MFVANDKVAMSAMNQALSWSEDDDSGAGKFSFLKIVVLEGMFIPEDFEEEAFLGELEEDIAGECGKCGVIEKITVFSGNPRGIVVVKFGTSFSAQQCISMMDGRFFGGRKIRCFFWDQVTNYTVVDEAKEDQLEKKRIEEFGDWLENAQEDLPEEFKLQVEG
jgi:HIV Tat-specific factor 1